jgi:hypothetical protein
MNPRPLDPLVSSPRYLLEKARRDLDRLDNATIARDELAAFDAMIDAAISVYHVKDWIAAAHSGYKVAAETCANESKWILLCRDICHASKHVGLRLDRRPYSETPPVADYVDYTAQPSASVSAWFPLLKVFSAQYGNHYAAEVIRDAIADWDAFISARKID